MSFVSLEFLLFLPIVIGLYYILPHKFRWAFLLAASYYFYAFSDFRLFFLIFSETFVSYLCGIFIEKSRRPRMRRVLLGVTLVFCLGLLGYFKYAGFLQTSANTVLHLVSGQADVFTVKNVLLPVGISFFTFQTLSYVLDIYYGIIPAEKHFGYYALYVAFFPQLVAGPIERSENLLPQLKQEHTLALPQMQEGVWLLLCGFTKKVAIADVVGKYVDRVYMAQDVSAVTGLAVIFATLLFVLQVYCDFSGYSDIAMGCAKMLGIDLMQNFDRPFLSQSVSEFWKRWHISLSGWFNDYVYIPLTAATRRKKHKAFWHAAIILCVFFLSGLWHGANWTFVFWGALHGAYQVVGSATKKYRMGWQKKLGIDRNSNGQVLLRRGITFGLVAFSMIFFRANSMADAFSLIRAMLTQWDFTSADLAKTAQLLQCTAMTLLEIPCQLLLLNLLNRHISLTRGKIAWTEKKSGSAYAPFYLVAVIISAWLLALSQGQASSFIYFQF